MNLKVSPAPGEYEARTMLEGTKDLLVHSGATWVLWLLIALSVVCLAVVLDRARLFWHERGSLDPLVRELHALLGRGEVEAARLLLSRSRRVAARVALSGLAQWENGASAALEAMAAARGVSRERLERRLLALGTVGSNAPFVGLLGTVIGVVGAFEELGRTDLAAAATGLAPERVMASIAEALVATAIGLLVAIPAVVLFNAFQGLLEAALSGSETLGHVLLTHIDRPRRRALERDQEGA
jgi:biopolymer transport protein ExbB